MLFYLICHLLDAFQTTNIHISSKSSSLKSALLTLLHKTEAKAHPRNPRQGSTEDCNMGMDFILLYLPGKKGILAQPVKMSVRRETKPKQTTKT